MLFTLLGIGTDIAFQLPVGFTTSNSQQVYSVAGNPSAGLAANEFQISDQTVEFYDPTLGGFGAPIGPATVPIPFSSPLAQVQISVNTSGNLNPGAATNNDFVVTGDTTIGGTEYDGTLVTGKVLAFGYSNPGDPSAGFDFVFAPTSGQLVQAGFFTGKDIGLSVSLESTSFNGSFSQDFSGVPKAFFGPVGPSLGPSVPTITTTQQPAVATVGSVIADQATVTGNNPTGTVTFNLYNNATGTGPAVFTDPNEPLVNGVATSAGYPATATGTYYWVDTYNGDANNSSVASALTAEPVVITSTIPSINTTQQPASATVGSSIADKATVTGLVNASSSDTVTFNLYSSATTQNSSTLLFTSTQTISLSGGTATATAASYTAGATGTDYWVATFNGDSNNIAVTSGATAEPVSITPKTPSVSTTPSASTTVTGGGAFATIGFWHNKNGQALITSFGGSLGTSLATAYPNLFGSPNPYISASLAGQTSSGVAAAYLGLWTPSGLTKNTYVQAFAVALGAFPGGGSSATFNVGSNGAAFGVPNGTTLSIGAILSAINANFNPATGLFYGGNQALTSAANNVLNGINVSGEQGGGGSTVTVNTLNDSATLSGGFNDTGTLTFYLMGPGSTASTPLSSAVYTDVVTVTGNGTYSTATQGTNAGGFNPTATGTYEWVVVYSGDTVNAPVTSAFGSEPWTVGQQNETFFTTPSTTSVVLGTSSVTLKDTATIQGGTSPTGTITWTLFLGATKLDTETVTVNGNGNYTTPTGYTIPTTGNVTGTYQWNATYSGDTNNAADSDNNDPSERTVVSAASPAIATVASESTSGDTTTVSDQAVLSGGVNPSGSITFSLYYNGGTTPLPGDTETVTVNGNGTYTTPTPITVTAAGTYTWHAVYSGDSNNSTAIDNGQNETVTVAAPPVTAGEFATIGFWHNKNGQAVIYNFNGSSSATKLGNWLATNFPHLFGASNPYTGTSLAGLTNAQIGTVYLNLWNPSGVTKNTYVQAFAVALGIYADTSSLGGSSVSASYGFTVSATGGGSATYGLGNNGAAFPGLGSNPTVLQILEAVDANFNPSTGLFYGGNQALTSDANNVLNGINTAGDI